MDPKVLIPVIFIAISVCLIALVVMDFIEAKRERDRNDRRKGR